MRGPYQRVAQTARGPATERGARVDERVLRSSALLDGNREIFIQHGLDRYRLRLTNSGKLILTK